MRLVRYATVGVANTLLTFVAFAVLTHAGVAATFASALAFAVGAMNGYALNRRWTFRTRGRFGRYVAVQALGAACSAAGIVIVAAAITARRPLDECLVIPAVTLLTYTLSRRVVFAR
jgi:putative flippase GtrA